MYALEQISTSGVRPAAKLDFWNQTVSTAVRDIRADPADPAAFSGCLRRVDVEQIRLVEICGDASRIFRPALACGDRHVVLELLLSGEYLCQTNHGEHQLQPGDFWLIPETCCTMRIPGRTTVLSLRMPRQQLGQYLLHPESVASVRICGSSGPGALVSGYLRQLWQGIRNNELIGHEWLFSAMGLRLIATAFLAAADRHADFSMASARHQYRARLYIERHLADPELDLTQVASALGITRRYLHQIFADQPESVSRYILRRRLEECHQLLAGHRAATRRSITEVALSQGFNSISHFCRVFRARYHVTPSELLHAARPQPPR